MHGILIAYLVLLSVVLLSVSISYLKKGFNNEEVTLTSKDLIKRSFFMFFLWNMTWPLWLALLHYNR